VVGALRRGGAPTPRRPSGELGSVTSPAIDARLSGGTPTVWPGPNLPPPGELLDRHDQQRTLIGGHRDRVERLRLRHAEPSQALTRRSNTNRPLASTRVSVR
jgi:hypothetical protein